MNCEDPSTTWKERVYLYSSTGLGKFHADYLHSIGDAADRYGRFDTWLHWRSLRSIAYKEDLIGSSTFNTFTSFLNDFFEFVPEGEPLVAGEFLFEKKEDQKGIPHFRVTHYEPHLAAKLGWV